MAAETHTRTFRLILADDHELVRAGIRSLLEQIAGVQIVAEARDGEDLVRVVDDLVPDIVLTDITMPRLNGFEAMERIRDSHPAIRLVALSMNNSAAYIKRAVACGACGYLMKDAAPTDLEQTVRGVMARGHHFNSSIAQLLLQPSPPAASDLLTARQIEVLAMLARGRCSKQIGHDLGLSSKTVDVHRAHIMERLQLNGIASLTRYALREGLVAE